MVSYASHSAACGLGQALDQHEGRVADKVLQAIRILAGQRSLPLPVAGL